MTAGERPAGPGKVPGCADKTSAFETGSPPVSSFVEDAGGRSAVAPNDIRKAASNPSTVDLSPSSRPSQRRRRGVSVWLRRDQRSRATPARHCRHRAHRARSTPLPDDCSRTLPRKGSAGMAYSDAFGKFVSPARCRARAYGSDLFNTLMTLRSAQHGRGMSRHDLTVEVASLGQLVGAFRLAHCWPSVHPTLQRRRSRRSVCTRTSRRARSRRQNCGPGQ